MLVFRKVPIAHNVEEWTREHVHEKDEDIRTENRSQVKAHTVPNTGEMKNIITLQGKHKWSIMWQKKKKGSSKGYEMQISCGLFNKHHETFRQTV